MDAVRNIAGDVLHGSEDSVAQSERLNDVAFQLEESIAEFNLDAGAQQGRQLRPAIAPRQRTQTAKALPARSSPTSTRPKNGSPSEANE
jgi:hypothetical protein